MKRKNKCVYGAAINSTKYMFSQNKNKCLKQWKREEAKAKAKKKTKMQQLHLDRETKGKYFWEGHFENKKCKKKSRKKRKINEEVGKKQKKNEEK